MPCAHAGWTNCTICSIITILISVSKFRIPLQNNAEARLWKEEAAMIRRNQSILNIINMLLDAALVFCAYLLATYIRFDIMYGIAPALQLAWNRKYFEIAAVYAVVLVVVFYAARLYGSYRFQSQGRELAVIFTVNAVGVSVLTALLYVTRFADFSRLAIFMFFALSTLFVSLKRICVRAVLRHYRKLGYNQKHVIVVGNGHFAHQYMQDVKANPYMGFTVDGYISKVQRSELGKCLGTYEELENILEKNMVDEVIVALEPHEIQFMKQVLDAADKLGARISIIPFYNDYIPAHPSIDVVGKTKLINMRATPLDNVLLRACKRCMDIAGALVLIVLTSPLMLAAAAGVRLSSPGPVLFRQERVGKDKKPFRMYKFRSMRVTGTEDTGWSTDNDPRKTRFGSFIRKYSIDELPQFFNVLKGDMSLIGPRPEIPFHVNHFKEEIPLYLVRQQVRPGITGWAQVHGLRGDTSIEKRVQYDIWYIENWSLWLDIKILFMTVFGGMKNSEQVTK